MGGVNRRPIRLLALDLDGTLVGPEGMISAKVRTAVREATARGVEVVIATGRMVQSAAHYWGLLGLGTGWLIAYNGGVVAAMPDGVPLMRRLLPDGAARLLIGRALAADILVQVYVGQELWVSREDDRVRDYVDAQGIPEWVKRPADLFAWPEPPIKLLLQAPSAVLDRFREEIAAEAAELGVRVFKSQAEYLEMVPEGVGKGPALSAVAARLNVLADEVMAIGDAENDIDMLQWAGLGVAMGQAREEVRRAARAVTGSIGEDGAATAIEKYILSAAPGV